MLLRKKLLTFDEGMTVYCNIQDTNPYLHTNTDRTGFLPVRSF
jgi:hypothetical protein